MIKQIFILSTLLCVLNSCSQSQKGTTSNDPTIIENPEYGILQDAENPPVRFELVSSTELIFENDLIIGNINAFTVDDNGNMYFLDSNQGKMVSLDPNGEFRFVTGQKGRGPGDIENAYSIAYNDQTIYLTNVSSSRIDAFDLQGNFISSTNQSKDITFGTIIGFTDDEHIIFRSVVWGELADNMAITELTGDSIAVSNQFKVSYTEDVQISSGMSSSADMMLHDNELYAGHLSDYMINIYDLKGNRVKTIQRNFNNLIPPGFSESSSGSTIMGFGGVYPVGVLSNGYLFVRTQWPTNVKDPNEHVKKFRNGNAPDIVFANSLDVFDSNGTLLYSFESKGMNPEIGAIQFIDNKDHIYTVGAEGTTLNKYKIYTN
jgi:hypothetical protein